MNSATRARRPAAERQRSSPTTFVGINFRAGPFHLPMWTITPLLAVALLLAPAANASAADPCRVMAVGTAGDCCGGADGTSQQERAPCCTVGSPRDLPVDAAAPAGHGSLLPDPPAARPAASHVAVVARETHSAVVVERFDASPDRGRWLYLKLRHLLI